MPDSSVKNPLIRQGWLRVLLFGACYCILTLLIAIPVVLVVTNLKVEDLEKDLIHSLSSQLSGEFQWLILALELIISLISVWIFRVFVDRKSFASLGLRLSGYQSEAVTGLFMGPALLGIGSLILFLSGHVRWTDINFDPQSLGMSFGSLVLIAFSEELVFRGYILSNVLESFNKWIALCISAGLFAVFHLTNPGMNTLAFANLFLAGILLGINYIYTRNLWFSLLFHLSWNFFQGPLLGFNVSGLSLPSLLPIETKGDISLTGGDFGLEGSVVITAISIIAALILNWAFERKYKSSMP